MTALATLLHTDLIYATYVVLLNLQCQIIKSIPIAQSLAKRELNLSMSLISAISLGLRLLASAQLGQVGFQPAEGQFHNWLLWDSSLVRLNFPTRMCKREFGATLAYGRSDHPAKQVVGETDAKYGGVQKKQRTRVANEQRN